MDVASGDFFHNTRIQPSLVLEEYNIRASGTVSLSLRTGAAFQLDPLRVSLVKHSLAESWV